MKVVNLQCPNCGARLTIENDKYVCNSCGTSIAIDYDESDVEFERIKTEAERDQRQLEHEKNSSRRNMKSAKGRTVKLRRDSEGWNARKWHPEQSKNSSVSYV